MAVIKYLDGTNNVVQLSATVDNVGNLVGSTCITDPNVGNKAAVQQFHAADGQVLGTGYGIYTGGVEVVFNGASYDRSRSAPGNLGSMLVSSDGAKLTYRYASAGNTPAATPTDVFVLQGSNTKTIRVKRITLSGTATTTAGQFVWFLLRRVAANSGGTSTNPVGRLNDINDSAATATCTLYTANPTSTGGLVGSLRVSRLFHNLTTGQPDRVVWDYCANQDKALILRSNSDFICINGNGATLPTSATLDIDVEWEEDNS